MPNSMELSNSNFYCPITSELMTDPVMDPDGNTYERAAIEAWLERNNTSPLTGNELTIGQLIPNRTLREAIEDEIERISAINVPLMPSTSSPTTSFLGLALNKGISPQTIDILASINPPAFPSNDAIGSDICCVVDVSGSMGGNASIIGVENSGLSLLDITKHGLKTIISSLQDNDRLSLVSYSSAAKVVCYLTPMTTSGKEEVLSLVNTLRAEGTTNLWDGLKKGLDTLAEASTVINNTNITDNEKRNAALFLLTDGEPNVEPPRGHIPMLKRYREKNQGHFPGIISTFGFGYSVKSSLLRDIATEGGGMYAFIPDAGFVGTAFVNALANVLATMGTNALLTLQVPPQLHGCVEISALGHPNASIESTGVTLDLGSIKFGQRRDTIFRVTLPHGVCPENCLVVAGSFKAKFSYNSFFPGEEQMPLAMISPQNMLEFTTSANAISADDMRSQSYLSSQLFRSETTMIISDMLTSKLASPHEDISYDAIRLLMNNMRQWMAINPKRQREPYTIENYDLVDGLLKDLSGQVLEAVQEQYFRKWGRHYLPSLSRAHQLQECMNFKDPGVQQYGGEMFRALRDDADDAFNTLPPPHPSLRSPINPLEGLTNRSNCLPPPVCNMTAFNSASAPCFHGSCLVHMSDGTLKAVADVSRGDHVICNTHIEGESDFAEVECVVQTNTSNGYLDLIHLKEGLMVTPYHPVHVPLQYNGNRKWQFPIDCRLGKLEYTACSSVYSFILRPPLGKNYDERCRAKSMLINNVPCITLAHGIDDDDVATHPFYGSESVAESLQHIDKKGWSAGRVVLREGCVLKDPMSGLACGFRHTSNEIPVE